jgi:hypothetical protein
MTVRASERERLPNRLISATFDFEQMIATLRACGGEVGDGQ